MPLCRRLRVSSSRRSLVPVWSAFDWASGTSGGVSLVCVRRVGPHGPGHAASSLSLVMSSMRLSCVASRTGCSPVMRPAESV